MIDKPQDRVYRGIAADIDDVRILVMAGGAGPTERERATLLYALKPSEPFWWGYGGGSPSRTAQAILDDLLPDALSVDLLKSLPTELRQKLTIAFIDDFLAYFHDSTEFWLPSRTVVRWIHGFLREMQWL